ncbi:MAG: Inner membrane protein YijD [Candidatus Celerinatantimonas neptuna]|nr:MAG: Inner membrane protein YijD [Candidatus Celerinatantimonas neptuna]
MKIKHKSLLLALLCGFTGNASLATVTIAVVPFSIFPWLSFVLAIWLLYQTYLSESVSGATPLYSGICILLGVLVYSVMLRVQYPQVGSNFLPLMICLVLLAWLAVKLRWFNRHDD